MGEVPVNFIQNRRIPSRRGQLRLVCDDFDGRTDDCTSVLNRCEAGGELRPLDGGDLLLY